MARPVIARVRAALGCAFVLSACGGSPDAAPAGESANRQPPTPVKEQGALDERTLRAYRLEMPKVRRYYAASGDLESLVHKDTAFRRSFMGAESPAERATVLQEIPAARQAVMAAGLSPREFVIIETMLQSASLVHTFRKDGQDVPPGDNETHVRFVQENEAELTRLWQERIRRAQAVIDSLAAH